MPESVKDFFNVKSNKPEKSPLDKFREKMWGLKNDEGITGITAHFKFINPDELDEWDMKTYVMVTDSLASMERLFDIIRKRKEELTQPINKSQKDFLDYLANLVQIRMERIVG